VLLVGGTSPAARNQLLSVGVYDAAVVARQVGVGLRVGACVLGGGVEGTGEGSSRLACVTHIVSIKHERGATAGQALVL
jgi:hypothetical protein